MRHQHTHRQSASPLNWGFEGFFEFEKIAEKNFEFEQCFRNHRLAFATEFEVQKCRISE